MGVRAGEEERGKERYMKAKSFFFFLYLKSKQANKQIKNYWVVLGGRGKG